MSFGPPCHQCGSEFDWYLDREGERCQCGWPETPMKPDLVKEPPQPPDKEGLLYRFSTMAITHPAQLLRELRHHLPGFDPAPRHEPYLRLIDVAPSVEIYTHINHQLKAWLYFHSDRTTRSIEKDTRGTISIYESKAFIQS